MKLKKTYKLYHKYEHVLVMRNHNNGVNYCFQDISDLGLLVKKCQAAHPQAFVWHMIDHETVEYVTHSNFYADVYIVYCEKIDTPIGAKSMMRVDENKCECYLYTPEHFEKNMFGYVSATILEYVAESKKVVFNGSSVEECKAFAAYYNSCKDTLIRMNLVKGIINISLLDWYADYVEHLPKVRVKKLVHSEPVRR